MIDVNLDNANPDTLRKLNRAFPERYPFLLQSTARSGALGRYDILFAFPDDKLVLDKPDSLSAKTSTENKSFLRALDDRWRREVAPPAASELPFRGGWFLYLGYELVSEIEPTLTLGEDTILPTAFAVRCPAAVIFDHVTGACSFVSELADGDELASVLADVEHAHQPLDVIVRPQLVVHEEPAEKFIAAVLAAQQYIASGDIYQANLSREWHAEIPAEWTASDIYASLCEANPAPFAGLVHWQGASIISSSPERLVAVRNGTIATRPIAGTRPRGRSSDADDELLAELIAHPKERAEHVMLIDLERNDLGRVAVAGTVEVNEMMALESYEHVHHIVSNVRGKLRSNVTPGEAIAAVFPGGTITGCPKVRCMEIIDELEQGPRGAYTGAFGYLNLDGSLDLNILIRTIVKDGNSIKFRAGGGIVADSEPQAELHETRAKAEGLIRAMSRG